MAVSQIEEKILGQIAKETASSDATLSSSFYQVLGLSILLSRRLIKARRIRKLDTTRDNKSLQLYHHIIWLTREGLWTTEYCILPFCRNGEQGPECRVMAAKLRASFYHVFCLFHNDPPVYQLSGRSPQSGTSPSTVLAPKANNGQSRTTSSRSPKDEDKNSSRRAGKAPLRDPIPSMVSEASYITNPYSSTQTQTQTPPPNYPIPPIPSDARRTPTRPPGLSPANAPSSQRAGAPFILPSRNFIPTTQEYFTDAQTLATSLLSPAHALRLSTSLEHSAFIYDCLKEPDRARRLARKTIKEVYASSEGLDDEEFADAAALVSALGGIVRRGTTSGATSQSQKSQEQLPTPTQTQTQRAGNTASASRTAPPIDRTIAISPTSNKRSRTGTSPSQFRSITGTPERLSTVLEVDSVDPRDQQSQQRERESDISPPISRLSSQSRDLDRRSRRRDSRSPHNSNGSCDSRSSTSSEKSSSNKRRRAMDSSAHEPTTTEVYGGGRNSSPTLRSNVSGSSPRHQHSASTPSPTPSSNSPTKPIQRQELSRLENGSSRTQDSPRKYHPHDHRAGEKRDAILKTLAIVSTVSTGGNGGLKGSTRAK